MQHSQKVKDERNNPDLWQVKSIKPIKSLKEVESMQEIKNLEEVRCNRQNCLLPKTFFLSTLHVQVKSIEPIKSIQKVKTTIN